MKLSPSSSSTQKGAVSGTCALECIPISKDKSTGYRYPHMGYKINYQEQKMRNSIDLVIEALGPQYVRWRDYSKVR